MSSGNEEKRASAMCCLLFRVVKIIFVSDFIYSNMTKKIVQESVIFFIPRRNKLNFLLLNYFRRSAPVCRHLRGRKQRHGGGNAA